MADTASAANPPSLTEILANDNQSLVVRLAAAPFPTPLSLATIVQSDFPGYLPARELDWQRVDAGGDDSVSIIRSAARFTWHPPRPGAQQVLGCYVTWEPDGLPVSLLGAYAFRVGEQVSALKANLQLSISLAGYVIEPSSGQQTLLQMGANAIAWAGASTLYNLSGYDLQILRTLNDALIGALQRDADIPDLTPRSTRSKTPLIETGDTQLAAACTLLQARLNLLLGL